MKSDKILVIVGPTASGKSDLAVRLAKKFNGEIISADSRQVYKGLNVGSGKITKQEMKSVPHHLLNVADAKKQFTVAQYKTLGLEAIKKIRLKNKLPIIVGGTGFYIDTLAGRSVFPDVPPNKKLRKELEKKTAEELFKILEKKDAKRAENIDARNKVRLIRALEIVEALGKVPKIKSNASENFIYIGLKPNKLEEKIHRRLLARMDGIIKEGKKLRKQGLSYKRMFELGLEYRYVSLYLQNELTREEMVAELFKAIKQYAKRQMTWFKRNKNIKWFEVNDDNKIEDYIKDLYKRKDRPNKVDLN